MSRAVRFPAARRAATLASALAVVLFGTHLYSNNIRGPQDSRNPAVSSGSITLAANSARAADRPARKPSAVIVWPSTWEGGR